ncbi:MAG: chemotaxis protein CheW [Candidatus Kapaibacterium sp.]
MENKKEERCWKTIGVLGDGSCEQLDKFVHCRHCPVYSTAGRNILDRPAPDSVVEEWTLNIASEKETEPPDTIPLVIFRIYGDWLALRASAFQEMIDVREVHSVPFRTNRFFRGLVNVNGELLLCLSMAALLDIMQSGEDKFSRMIVVRSGADRYVFAVHEMPGVLKIPTESIGKTPSTLAKSPMAFSRGIFEFDGKKVGMIDEAFFFDSIARRLVW